MQFTFLRRLGRGGGGNIFFHNGIHKCAVPKKNRLTKCDFNIPIGYDTFHQIPKTNIFKRARDEKKMHKRKVKAEQREKREKATVGAMPAGFVMRGSPPSSSSSSPHHHHSHSHKAKRPTHSKHRQERSSGEWEAALERLEAEFGEDLCGLSGLCLVASLS